MTTFDSIRLRRPSSLVRLLGLSLFVLGLILPAKSLVLILGGSLVSVIGGSFGLVTWLGSLGFEFLLILTRWEIVVDRGARTVTRRVRLIRTIQLDQYTFDDFEAVEIRCLGEGSTTSPKPFAIVLVGPEVSLDIDDPGRTPSALMFQVFARLAADFDRPGRLALAASLADLTGLVLQDSTGLIKRSADSSRRRAFSTRLLDSGDSTLNISRVPLGARLACLILLVSGSVLVALAASQSPVGGGLVRAGHVVDLLSLSILPLGGVVGLLYRSSVVVDFPSRLVRRWGSYLGTRWDTSESLDQFEAVLVREIKVPFLKTPGRSVLLSGELSEITLYDDRGIPRALRSQEAGLDRGQRCLASAELLAALCGFPLRVDQVGYLGAPAGVISSSLVEPEAVAHEA